LVGTLGGQFHLTQRKVQDVQGHVMGIRFSLGTVSQAYGLVSQALAAPVAQLHAELQHAPVCCSDETRHQSHQSHQSRELTVWMWMWVLASDWGVRLRIDPSRAQLAAKLLLGERPSNAAVSDRCAGCNHLPIEQRQVCWAHLLRDFERIAGRTGLGGRVGRRLLGYGCLLFRWRAADKPSQNFEWLQKRIRAQLNVGNIFSTVQTCKMQGRVAYEFITDAVQSWCGQWRPPSLVPEHIHFHHTYA
jgi:hypothetical protein